MGNKYKTVSYIYDKYGAICGKIGSKYKMTFVNGPKLRWTIMYSQYKTAAINWWYWMH